jgi:hypothetical protein
MKEERNRIIVVLGMHRSGTSAITRSLELLGVGLGDNLHPASIDNPKGFWEDRECLEINEQLLHQFGSAYNQLDLAWESLEDDPVINALKLKATNLISRKLTENNGMWGFKDPRTCRLLSFWREIFQTLGCEVNFVITLRNPASVTSSLAARDHTPPRKSYFLWLQHILPTIIDTKGYKRVVVDYDEFIDTPFAQLQRISSILGLQVPDHTNPLVQEFENNFLEKGLRHTRFSEAELARDSCATLDVVTAYKLLLRVARDQDRLDDPAVFDVFVELNTRLKAYAPIFKYANALEDEKLMLSRTMADRDAQIAGLNQRLNAMHKADEEMRTSYIWLQKQRDAWEKTAKTQEEHAQSINVELDEMRAGNIWLQEQRDAWEKAAKTQEEHAQSITVELDEMRAGNIWLQEQRDAWEKAAKSQEEHAQSLKLQLEEMQTSNACLQEQRDAWEKAAKSQEEHAQSLKVQIEEMQTSNVWLQEQRDSWMKAAKDHKDREQLFNAQHESIQARKILLLEQRDIWQQKAETLEEQVKWLKAEHDRLNTNLFFRFLLRIKVLTMANPIEKSSK